MKTLKIFGAIVVGVVLIAGGYLLARPHAAQTVGDVQPNAQWFSNGYAFGANSGLYSSAKLVIGTWANQASWQNNTGRTVDIEEGKVLIATPAGATTTSSFRIFVGTSTTPTITDNYLNPWPVLPFIYGLLVPTSTTATASGGASGVIIGDNFSNHATTSPAEIQVPAGAYLIAQAETSCKGNTGGCNDATSTSRVWTTITIPFIYQVPNQF